MKLVIIVLGLVFLLFSYFQFNDPDPEIWVPVYSMAALACYMAHRELWPSWVFYIMAAAYLVGAIWQWPPAFEGVFFGEIKMKSLNIELARESFGVGICTLAMVFLGWQAKVNPPTAI
ncbi:transmembrane 220 family protein [Persicitalea sp.]|uniref:transmembrane 220 family protein n=1 Tax=Persicitalea sp. TaxID=3100273 RepID=UPI0035948D41